MLPNTPETERIRALAESLECALEEDVRSLAGWTPGTAKTHRKRGDGPPYIRFGRAYLYPKKGLAEWLHARVKERTTVPARSML